VCTEQYVTCSSHVLPSHVKWRPDAVRAKSITESCQTDRICGNIYCINTCETQRVWDHSVEWSAASTERRRNKHWALCQHDSQVQHRTLRWRRSGARQSVTTSCYCKVIALICGHSVHDASVELTFLHSASVSHYCSQLLLRWAASTRSIVFLLLVIHASVRKI
jgi:hypothetical protein